MCYLYIYLKQVELHWNHIFLQNLRFQKTITLYFHHIETKRLLDAKMNTKVNITTYNI